MAASVEKAKIARRMVEVLDYFDDDHQELTVMDIVRRYNRPQSSTSELLSSLVDLGILYKNPYSRSYSLTPRAAMLAATAQPEIIRSGRLTEIVDRLVAQTGLTVCVFGMVRLTAQIFHYKSGNRPISAGNSRGIWRGLQESLVETAAGHLLLSTLPQTQCDGILRRLNAEAPDDRKFAPADMKQKITACVQTGASHGPAGFGTAAETACILLPGQNEKQPLAIGFVYEPNAQLEPETLIACLREAVARATQPAKPESTTIYPAMTETANTAKSPLLSSVA